MSNADVAQALVPTPSRPAGEAARGAHSPRLGDLPQDALHHVARFSRPRDVLALGTTNRAIAEALGPNVRAARLQHIRVPRVTRLEQFDAVLQEIRALPQDVQADPLAALVGRIQVFPEPERNIAVEDFLALPRLDEHGRLLDELHDAAMWNELPEREIVLASPGGAAYSGVAAGERPGDVMQSLAISGPEAGLRLIDLALSLPGRAPFDGGETVGEVVRRLGVTDAILIGHVESLAVQLAAFQITNGVPVPEVIDTLGISDPRNREALHHFAAEEAVSEGMPVHQAIAEFGIDERHSDDLQMHAAITAGLRAVLHGEAIEPAAERLGITSARARGALADMAVRHLAAPAVALGEDVEPVAQRMGIHAPQHLEYLARVMQYRLARSAVVEGMPVPQAAQMHGVDPQETSFLQSLSANTAGLAAVLNGGRVDQVAASLGIVEPRAVQDLERLAVQRIGLNALMSGQTVESIVERLGLVHPQSIQLLMEAEQASDRAQ